MTSLWLTLVACSPEEAASTSGLRDTLVIAQQSDISSLNPITAQSASNHDVIDTMNRHLIRKGFDCGLTFHPDLATSWEFNEDSTQLRVHLREDALWSDGVPVTAGDVAFTYALVADDLVASPRRPAIEKMVADNRVEVVSDHELIFHFVEAYDQTTMLGHASLVRLVPEHILKDADRATLRGHVFGREPVVNGPWRIERWEPNDRVVIEPVEDWWGPEEQKPQLRRIIFKVLPEYATRVIELENGNSDMVQSLEVADADRIAKEHPEIGIQRRGWRSTDYLAWNRFNAESYGDVLERLGPEDMDWDQVEPHPLFSDAEVRRALSLAIDVDKLIADLLTSKETGEVYGKRAVSTVSPEICDYHNGDIVPLPHDPDEARRILASKGWSDSDGDGILDRDGVPFAFTLLTNSGNPRRAKASVIMQANLAEIGVDVTIDRLESNTFFSRLREKDFEVALSGWSAATFVDMSNVWHSGHQNAQNYTSYSNPEVDALIDQALRTADPAEAQAIWKDVQARIHADQPYTFLYWRDEIIGLHKRFGNARIDFLYPYRDVETWSVAPEDVKYAK